MEIKVRVAEKKDMKRVHQLIVQLAIYEKAPNEVVTTADTLIADGFGEGKGNHH